MKPFQRDVRLIGSDDEFTVEVDIEGVDYHSNTSVDFDVTIWDLQSEKMIDPKSIREYDEIREKCEEYLWVQYSPGDEKHREREYYENE